MLIVCSKTTGSKGGEHESSHESKSNKSSKPVGMAKEKSDVSKAAARVGREKSFDALNEVSVHCLVFVS